jgi:hypothetical protein
VLTSEARRAERADMLAKRFKTSLQLLVDAGDGQPCLDGADGGLGAVGYFQLGEDAPHLRFYGAHAEEQVLGDLGVGLSLAQ